MLLVLARREPTGYAGARPFLDQLALIARGHVLVGVTVVLFAYLIFRPLLPSRLLFAYVWVFAVLLLGAARLLTGPIQAWQRRRGIGVERVLVVGAGQVGRAVMQNVLARPDLGYVLVGFVDDDPAKQEDIGRARALGTTCNVSSVVEPNGSTRSLSPCRGCPIASA